MKIILLISAMLLAMPVAADYVSPLKYKGYSCDELKAEYRFILEHYGMTLYNERDGRRDLYGKFDSPVDAVEYARLNELYGEIQNTKLALDEAMKRISCKGDGEVEAEKKNQ